jgi:nucleoside-diphosphate-sugar epimerase
MRVVVTGATGNVGTSVVQCLAGAAEVEAIVGIARRAPAWEAPKTTFVTADVSRDDLRPHLAGADVVVHLAWLFQPTHQPMVTWESNVGGSLRVFEAAVAAGAGALVHASSVGAYSPAPGRFVDETWPTHGMPTAAYGREKAYLERALDALEARYPALRVVRMRPAFIFKPESATEQRRLFAGPFVPNWLGRPGVLPFLPLPAGLRFQTVHTEDVAEAYRLAVVGGARGAFNLASAPEIDAATLGELFGTRTVTLPRPLVRAAVAAAWHARLVPADPKLLDLFLQLPLLDTTRAKTELGWMPQHSSQDALRDLLDGLVKGAGMATEPLAPDTAVRRIQEVADAG